MVMLVGYAACLPVTHGYVSSQKNMRNRLRRPLPGILVPTPKILESAWDRVFKKIWDWQMLIRTRNY